ncbi:hypothetical protein I4U23_029760 [Adineta vaga]|nr:hypothetical protein I4U23_029760 [Adineta vaga]
MIKSDSHDSGIEYHSHNERLIKDETMSRARRARRQIRTNSGTTSGDETKREVPDGHLRPPTSHRQRRLSPKSPDLPPLDNSTSVTIEHETKPTRKKKTFKAREGEDIEMTERKRSGSRRRQRRTTSKGAHSETETTIDHGRDKILGIVIHRTDRLRTDLRLRHPFIRVHLVDLSTRSYVRKTDPNRLVLRYHIQNEQATTDHIPAISTQPYDFHANRSTIPSWEQMLIINEEYTHFTVAQQQNICIFFEILEFVTNQQNINDLSNTFPIAWAFLKVIGARNTLNTERMIRLQLWQPIEQLRGSALTPDVILWYNHMSRIKYPSTLYVTIKPLNIPNHFNPGIRSALDGGIEQMRNEYQQIKRDLAEHNPDGSTNHLTETQQMDLNNEMMGPLQRVAQLPPRWQKLPNSKCKIPTESLLSLNTSDRGCSAIRFSHNGYFLACAEVNKLQQNNLISVFEIPRGQRVAVFTGHLQMIYDLDWSRSDCYLASASADSSVKIWNFEQTERKPWRSLAHPSYVYCVRFHPFVGNIIVTAGYDKLIRIWNIDKKHGHVIRTMADHLGYISSLSFNPDGTRLASVDSIGSIKVWHGLPTETSTSQIFADSWTLGSNLDFGELQNIPLNSVTYSPGDNYLLVSARDNLIVLIDARTKSISRRYVGSFNLQDRIRSTFSSCGSLVFAGSEDGQVHCWHTYNGNLLYSYKYINYTQPVVDIQFHPFDNLVAMCAIGPLHQVYVFQHTFNEADIEAKPYEQQNPIKTGIVSPTKLGTSMIASDTDRSIVKGRLESSGDELPRTVVSKNESKNRRLAVVNKILDEMDDVINPKSGTSRHRESITGYGGGHLMSRSTERDMSPYQGHRNIPTSGYNSDSGRPALVSPLRNLTSPDLFVPVSNRTDDDDYMYQRTSSSAVQIMYATTNYTATRAEELSFSKNDKIKILNKESHLLWYAEHVPTGARGYVSPNRVHINARDTYTQSPKATVSNTDRRPISEIPRLDNSSRRVQQKSVKFDSSD